LASRGIGGVKNRDFSEVPSDVLPLIVSLLPISNRIMRFAQYAVLNSEEVG